MIRETIITTVSAAGVPHVAPMGATVTPGGYLLQPFRPSRTLDNLAETGCGVVNYTDDVRVFAGCVTKRRPDWPTVPVEAVGSVRLEGTIAHAAFVVDRLEDDPVRPRFFCKVVEERTEGLFRGLNRAKAAVVEGAVLVSRLHMLPAEKIDSEIAYLQIAIDKTAGPEELEAWGWLMDAVRQFRERAAP